MLSQYDRNSRRSGIVFTRLTPLATTCGITKYTKRPTSPTTMTTQTNVAAALATVSILRFSSLSTSVFPLSSWIIMAPIEKPLRDAPASIF